MKHIAYTELGHANHGWLNARHHFSFGGYHDPSRMGFGTLRVINDDIIKAGTGFTTHPHENMEIITYVRSGAITHKDSNGNEGRTEAGDVQVMSAGTGIFHSEHNREDVDTTLYQIWITPNKMGVAPSWDAHEFPKEPTNDKLSLLVSGDGNAPLQINQDAFIYTGTLKSGAQIEHALKHQAYILVSKGSVEIDGELIKAGDGLEVDERSVIQLQAIEDVELLLLDVPAS